MNMISVRTRTPTLAAVATVAALSLTACLSAEETAQRQRNAFDVSGDYTTSAASEQKMSLRIQNQSGRHDIRVEIDRDGLTAREQELFVRVGLKPDAILSQLGHPMVLGEGRQNDWDGGENISDDMGESSKIRVFSRKLDEGSGISVSYSLEATIKKSDFVLRGSLIANVNQVKVEKDSSGKDVYHYYDLGSVALRVEAVNGTLFYQQYFGGWTGSVSVDEPEASSISQLNSLTIQKQGSAEFKVIPPITTLAYRGKTFTYEPLSFPLSDLSDSALPTFEIRFVSAEGERIVVLGTVYSLGNLAGTVVHLHGAAEDILASVAFHRN